MKKSSRVFMLGMALCLAMPMALMADNNPSNVKTVSGMGSGPMRYPWSEDASSFFYHVNKFTAGWLHITIQNNGPSPVVVSAGSAECGVLRATDMCTFEVWPSGTPLDISITCNNMAQFGQAGCRTDIPYTTKSSGTIDVENCSTGSVCKKF